MKEGGEGRGGGERSGLGGGRREGRGRGGGERGEGERRGQD